MQRTQKYSETQLQLMNKREKHCRTQTGRMGQSISEKKEMLATFRSQQYLHHTPLHV
jgi:hypothetical protein